MCTDFPQLIYFFKIFSNNKSKCITHKVFNLLWKKGTWYNYFDKFSFVNFGTRCFYDDIRITGVQADWVYCVKRDSAKQYRIKLSDFQKNVPSLTELWKVCDDKPENEVYS